MRHEALASGDREREFEQLVAVAMMLRLLVLLHLLVAPSAQQQQRQQRRRPDDYSGSTAPCAGRGTESYNGICTPSAFPPRLDPALNKQVQDPGYLRAPPALINITIGPYRIAIP